MNVDPLNNPPTLDSLKQNGIRVVRYVPRDTPEVGAYQALCDAANILTVGCVTAQSAGYVGAVRVKEIGNEPNLPGTADSLDPTGSDPDKSFAARLQLFRNTYDGPMIAGGLVADGSAVSYIQAVRAAGGLNGYVGVGLHYPAGAAIIKAVGKAAGLPVWVTEWHCPPESIPDYLNMLLSAGAVMEIPFCAHSGMVSGFGIMDDPLAIQMLVAARGI